MSDAPGFKKKIAALISFIFGTIIYRPPGFFAPLGQGIKTANGRFMGNLRLVKTTFPRATRALGILFLLLVVGGIGLGIYQATRPEIAKLKARVTSPALTPLQKDARPQPVFIRFSGSAGRLENVQKIVEAGIIMKPAHRGQWKWISDDVLQFTPADDWPAGTRYEIELEKSLFPDHVLLTDYDLDFKTRAFAARITSCKFYIDPRDEKLKHVSATVDFTHAVDPVSFENSISLHPENLERHITVFQKRDYKVTVTYDEFYGKAFLLSEPLPMPEDDVAMVLEVRKGVACAARGNATRSPVFDKVIVPGITNYVRVLSASQTMVRNDEYKLEQMLIVNTRGKVSGKDLMDNMEVWVLPVHRPAAPGIKEARNYHWSNPALVGPEVLNVSTRLTAGIMPAEHEYQELNSFRIDAEPQRYLYVRIKKGTPFYGQYALSKDFSSIIRVKAFPKQLEIMHEGVILASSGEKKVSLMSQGVNHVRFRIGRVQPDQLNHLVTQSNGNLKDIRFQNYRFDDNNIVQNYYETRPLTNRGPGEPNYFSFGFNNYLQPREGGKLKHGVFFLEVREWDPVQKRVFGERAKRLIMVSDLGLLVKDGTDDRHDLFVQSIKTGHPVPGARVQVLGKNGLPVLSVSTDQDGRVALPSLSSFRDEKSPTVYLVTKGDDLTFMPVAAPGRWLDYSRFDVGGVHGATDPNKINTYLFSNRGIYRPGDEFDIGMIIKSGDWDKALTGIPLEAAVIDARGLEIHKKAFRLSPEGFEELSYRTTATSPTGTWQVNLYTMRKGKRHMHVGSTTVKVEEFLPDRLAISSVFPGVSDRGWVAPGSLKGVVTLRNLFGSPAVGNRISARITLTPGRMWFREFREFTFIDPLTNGKSYSERLTEETTDEEGKALFDFGLNRFEAATYYLRFTADGFEKEGGRNVSTESRILVSPLPFLVGTKADGDLSYVYKDAKRSINLIAVNPALKQVAAPGLTVERNELRFISVLTKLPNGTYAYKSVKKVVPLSTSGLDIPSQGIRFPLATGQAGDYELVVKNAEGMIYARVLYSVIGMGNLTRSLDKTAELEVKLNKTDYDPGEEIEIYVKAPYTGAGLITIERDRVYAYKWFYSRKNSFIEKIRLPRDLEGNGYINVSFVRAADSKEIFMSPLSYGIAPFSVSKKNRMNPVTISIKGEARSGKPFPISYRTEKPAKIVVFAVDEGILQVAGYQTPDPLAHFFKKRALEVKTSQVLDLILPEFSLIQSLSAMGGGSGFDEIAKNLNPFKRKRHKPVVYWSGILNSDRQERTLSYTVPDYFNGTLRIMAVAVSPGAVGTYEEKAVVKNPFIISPNVPMFAAPRDSFQVSVTVTNGLDGSGVNLPVTLEVTGTENLKVYDARRRLKISEDRDTTLTFYVKALNRPGSAALTFTAVGKKESVSLATYLSVRPAQPYQTRVTTGVLENGKVDVAIPRRMYDDFRVLNASASFMPLGLSKGLTSYLDGFPYGCTEQVVSQAFPYLYLKDVNGFGITDQRAEEKVTYAFKVLQARQNSEGKFGIWAANEYTSDFITVYAAHFLTECAQGGYRVPDVLYKNTIRALKAIAGARNTGMRVLRIRAYAAYVLTCNEIITTNYIASIRKELKEGGFAWKQDITGAYLAASYRIMKQQRSSGPIFSDLFKGKLKMTDTWHFCDGFMQHGQLLYLVATHAPERLKDVTDRSLTRMATYLQEGAFNTLSSAYAVMALSAYAKAAGTPAEGTVALTQVFADRKRAGLALPAGTFPEVTFSEKATKLVVESKEKIPLYYQVVQGGFDTELPAKRKSEGIELFREFCDADGDPVTAIRQGDEVTVRIRFRSLKKRPLENIAIVDLLPAGLEAVPASVRGNTGGGWVPDYTDIREDRLIIFGTVRPEMAEFTYTVRAINRGFFTVPPLYGESMYDRSIYGISPQDPIVVE